MCRAVSGDREEERSWDAILDQLAERRAAGLGRTPGHPSRSPESLAGTRAQIEDIYLPLVESRTLVIAQLGQTLDGRIATCTGHSHFVTGPEDIRHLHRLRALVDAVVVGAGTVTADDPQLTVRHVRGENPVRVVLDPAGRVSPDRRMFRDRAAPTLWLQGPRAPAPAPNNAVEVLRLDEVTPGAGFGPAQILETLAGRGLRRVLVEGGGLTVSRFLAAGVLDRLHLTVAPVVLGSGRPSVTLDPVETLNEALRPRCRHFTLGQDILFDLYLRS
jgi:diaminohydroxyphosphoribosylaminopyrimidine deaminase / 5-amino-6-(5-phosphoribosylamino)uracil reductase